MIIQQYFVPLHYCTWGLSRVDSLGMSTTRKRSLSSVGRDISPPPAYRRKTAKVSEDLDIKDQCDGNPSLRIFSWNINGVNPLLQKQISFNSDGTYPLRTFLKRHGWPHYLCLQEVKINNQDEVTKRQLQHAANLGSSSSEPTYRSHFSLPRDRYNATGFRGKVHGVATLIREDVTSQIEITRKPDWDLEGRVLIHELSSGLVVVNGYWVNGTTNPYRNPSTGATEGDRHAHKLRFHQHMLTECLRLEQHGKHVILIGDINIARSRIDGHPNLRISPIQHVENRMDFNSKFVDGKDGLQGIDVFRAIHGDLQKFTYHPRGCAWGESCDRVDNIIVTRKLFESGAIKDTNICDNPGDRGHSDHVPLWIEVDTSKIPCSDGKTKENTRTNDI